MSGRGLPGTFTARGAEVVSFAALAVLACVSWSRMLADPPLVELVLTVVLATGLLLALLGLAGSALRRRWALVASAAATVIALIAAFALAGVPARLLAPGGWDELGPLLAEGLARAGQVAMPYDGDDASVGLALDAAAAALLVVAATLSAFGRRGRPRALAGMLPLLVLYGVGAALVESSDGIVRGFLLVALVAIWMWTCAARRPRARPALIAAGALALVGSLLGARAAAGEPGWDYRSWDPFGTERAGISFDWNHSYGPFEWPQEGTDVLRIEADAPAYWKASVLDRFDGVEWVRAEGPDRDGLQTGLVFGSEPSLERNSNLRRHSEWLRRFDVRTLSLESPFAIVAGATTSVYGLEGATISTDGTVELAPDPLARGDEYSVEAYVPDPSSRQLERQPAAYDPALAAYTSIDLPGEDVDGLREIAAFPPLGSGIGGEAEARRRVEASGYAGVLELTDDVTSDAETPWERVQAVSDYLADPRFSYFQSVSETELPLATFLLDDPRGYCQQFSGAMALMLRMSGVPARVVTGFAPGERGEEGADTAWTVTDREAHSWVEVYFERIGWVTFDPTPAAAPATRDEEAGAVATPSDSTGTTDPGDGLSLGRDEPDLDGSGAGRALPELGSGTAQDGSFPTAIVAGGVIGAAFVALAALATFRRRRLERLRTAGAAQLAELADALERLGWRPRPGETLGGLERRMRRDGATAAADYVATLSRARYSPAGASPPSPAARRRLRGSLVAGRGLRVRAASYLAIPPGGPSGRHARAS